MPINKLGKVNVNRLKMLLMLLPFYQINAVRIHFSSLYYILIALDLAVIVMLVLRERGNVINRAIMFLIFYLAILLFSTILHSRGLLGAFYYGGQLAGFVLLHSYYLKKETKIAYSFLEIERNILSVLLLIGIFFQFYDQGAFGVGEQSKNFYNFFASDNYLGYYYVPYVGLSLFIDVEKRKKVRPITYFFIILCVISLIKAWAVKAVIGIALVLIYILFVEGKSISKAFTFKRLSIVYIFVLTGVLFFDAQNIFSNMFENVFQKNADLTGRAYLWPIVIDNILKSPVIGYGIDNNGAAMIANFNGVVHASHNLVLEVLLETGIIGLFFYFGFIANSLYDKKMDDMSSRTYNMLVFISFVVFVMYIASHTLYIVGSYIPICLCMNFKKIDLLGDRKE